MKMYLLVYIFLLPAAVSDRKDKKIKNRWILLALAIVVPLAFCHEGGGPGTALLLLLRLIWPIGFFYPFFLCGGIGAGDVKLLAALSVLFCFREMLLFLFFCFLPAAVFSLGRMIRKKSLGKSLWQLFSYAGRIPVEGFKKKYQEPGQGERIPLAPFLLAAYTVFLFLKFLKCRGVL